MALLIIGKTKCQICGDVIEHSATSVSFSVADLPVDISFMQDATAHRRCLIEDPRRMALSAAWMQHWRAVAMRDSFMLGEDDGFLLFYKAKKSIFYCVYSLVFIWVQSSVGDLKEFALFLGSDAASLKFERTTYVKKLMQRGRVNFVASVAMTGWHVSAAGKFVDCDEEVRTVDYVFSSDEWSRFVDFMNKNAVDVVCY